jgi:23S rRNA pseudouridine2605 synthase
MPPRFAYWTIILDGAPTSFRTKDRDEILPLFNQLKAKNPGALLKWFSGGRLWDSPEQAKEVRNVEKVRRFRDDRAQQMKAEWSHGSSDPGSADPLAEFRRQHGRPADGSDQKPPAPPAWSPGSDDRGAPRAPRREGRGPGAPERRNKDWRPGGEHKDPRDKYKLPPGEARKRWKERNLGPRVPKPFGARPGGPKPFGSRPGGERPFGDRTRGPKPFGSKPGGGKPDFRSGGASAPPRPGDRPWSGKPRGPGGGRPFGDRPQGDRPFGDRPRGPKPFGSKPGGGKPFGARPRGPGKPPGGPRRKG